MKNTADFIRVILISALGISVVLGLSACGGSGFFQSQNPIANFTTQTQVFDDAHNQNKFGPALPRPFQPLYGYYVSGSGGAVDPATQFGSTESYTVYTNKNGVYEFSNPQFGNYEVYYNWLPEPYGCFSQNGPTDGSTPNGDWNVASAQSPGYEPLNEYINPINIPVMQYAHSSGGVSIPAGTFTAPAFNCNMVAEDLAGTDTPITTVYSVNAAPTPGATLTVTYPQLSQVAPPLQNYIGSTVSLLIYGLNGQEVFPDNPNSQPIANGYTAVFPFPTVGNKILQNGMYGTLLMGASGGPAGGIDLGAEGYFFIGSENPNYVEPFGVAAQDLNTMTTTCSTTYILEAGGKLRVPVTTCSSTSTSQALPDVTSLSGGTVSTIRGAITVGQEPVSIVAFGTQKTTTMVGTALNGTSTDVSGTGYAIVVNYASNSVSILDLFKATVVANVQVGSKPVSVVVDAANAYAYVTNYADSTVSKVSLSTYAVVATFAVGANPSAVSMDASGNLWVGGNGFIGEYNPQTYALITSSTVNGVVNSLEISSGQNKVITTVLQPATSGSPHAMAQVSSSSVSSLSSTSTQANGIGDAYTASTVASKLPTPSLLGGGTVVSANYGNNLSISATPTGFIVQDVYTGAVLSSGATTAPVRAIAVDQTYGYAYMTIPDTNTVITFPLP